MGRWAEPGKDAKVDNSYCSQWNEINLRSIIASVSKVMIISVSQERVEDSPALTSFVPQSPYTPHTLSITPSHRFVLAGYTQLGLKDISGSCRSASLHIASWNILHMTHPPLHL